MTQKDLQTNSILILMYITYHIRFSFTIPSDFSIVLLWRRAHLSEEDLRYLHTGTEDDRDRVHIRELEGDIEIVSRIDQACSIMHYES